jgi:hypothetical protein
MGIDYSAPFRDNFDHEPSDGNVWKMLLGSIAHDIDMHEEQHSSQHDADQSVVINSRYTPDKPSSAEGTIRMANKGIQSSPGYSDDISGELPTTASNVSEREKERFMPRNPSIAPSEPVRGRSYLHSEAGKDRLLNENESTIASSAVSSSSDNQGGVAESTLPTTVSRIPVKEGVDDTLSILTDGESITLLEDAKEGLIKNFATKLWNSFEKNAATDHNWQLTEESVKRISSALPDLLKEFAQDISYTANIKIHKKAISFIRHYRRQVDILSSPYLRKI